MTNYPISQPITIMMDDLIIEQLPKKIRKQLGDKVESGFHLGEGRRDLFFQNGVAQYKLGSSTIAVTID